MIRSLRLGNFKAFGETQKIPLRPLTLIYGPNSAGKSSIIHALALMHHAIATGDLDVHYPEIGGSAIDLGGFQQFVHRRDAFAAVEFGASFRVPRSDGVGVTFHIVLPHEEILEERKLGAGYGGKPVKLPTGRFTVSGPPAINAMTVEQAGEPLLTIGRHPDGSFFISRLVAAHPHLRAIFTHLVEQFTTSQVTSEDDLKVLATAASELVATLRWNSDGFLPSTLIKGQSGSTSGGVAISKGQRAADLTKAVNTFLPNVLASLVTECIGGLRAAIGQLTYLGPLRSYPPRHFTFSQAHEMNWRAGGEWAWHAIARREDIRERVNQWLGSDWLKTKYRLVLRDLLPADVLVEQVADAVEGQRERDLAAAKADLDAEEDVVEDEVEPARWIADAIRSSGEPPLQDLVFVDARSGTQVSHRDIGIGVSQVLPVLVTAFASENRLIAIEQPELHLHPALQAELADVFVESALGASANELLIETHSEHLLLRLMRRMRETFEQRLPAGARPLRPEDLCVLYVEPYESRSIVREMTLNERGELLKAWPDGFFEEGLREVFA